MFNLKYLRNVSVNKSNLPMVAICMDLESSFTGRTIVTEQFL